MEMFLFLDALPDRVFSGPRAERKPGPKGKALQGAFGIAWAGAGIWWADRRATGSEMARTFDSSYWGDFGIGLLQALLGGVAGTMGLVLAISLFFALVLGSLFLLRWLLMEVMSVASDPQNSPFTYAGSLIGLCALAVHLAYALMK